MRRAFLNCPHQPCVCRPSMDALEPRRLLSSADDGGELPRYLTEAERQFIAENPHLASSFLPPTAPPSGPIDPVAEYEPMEGLVLSWMSFTSILTQITKRVTDVGGRVYIGVTSSSAQSSATSTLIGAGVNLSNVTFFTVPLNSVWVRDYGPRYVYEGDVRVITDHRYNRPTRPSDDNQPVVFGNFKKHQYYEMGIGSTTLVHGGGNYHLDAVGDAYTTQLIVNENPSFTAAQIQQIYADYQNNNTTITAAFPTSVDATQHIDMWMQIYDDHKVFISDFPNPTGAVLTADQICETTATLMQQRGYQVTRLPAYSIGGVHYTFTNMVIFNNIVLLPQYNNGPGSAVSSQVLATVQAAFGPGKTVYPINADAIVPSAGVFHCIVQHVPVHKGPAGANGGLAPTAYLRGPNNGGLYRGGQQLDLEWISDDDAPTGASGVQTVDLLLSTDGGQTFPITIASGRPALGSFSWTIPTNLNTSTAIVRAVARDAANNTGFDQTDMPFTIDSIAPSITSGTFVFESEQRVDVWPSELATLSNVSLFNRTTNQTLSGSQLTITYNGASISIRPASLPLDDGNWRFNAPVGALVDAAGNSSTSGFSLDFFVFAGDANRDRTIDLSDFSILASRFNLPGTFSQGDFNYDGSADLADFSILASKFNTSLPEPPTPRPAGGGPTALGGTRSPLASIGGSEPTDRYRLASELLAADSETVC
ncbi:MAG: agmatine deiminase family protein [Phycisphaerae bacterium]|nr:agmatine deiminase family protein [Phycisphaerae bacterium]MDW8262658.1 agmatine deiminase family protein [Phycisphaerales bacterium]